jgi:hypothetical protein
MAIAASAAVAACGESKGTALAVCDRPRSQAAAIRPKAAPHPILALRARGGTAVVLARLSPRTLRPTSTQVGIGEYHDAWSLSPDGSRLALGISASAERHTGRIGVMVVELRRLTIVARIETGIAAEALGWLKPRRLAVGLLDGRVMLADPLTGKIVRRWHGFAKPGGFIEPRVSRQARDRLAVLFVDLLRAAGPGLAVVEAAGHLRTITLRHMKLAVHSDFVDAAGLAVDPRRARAYVVAAGAPAAEVDLQTMRVTYHRLEAGLEGQRRGVRARERHAVWLGEGKLVVFGRDVVRHANGTTVAVPAGVTLVDTANWSACTLNANAAAATLASNRLLVYGPGPPVTSRALGTGVGLQAFTRSGNRSWHRLDREQVWKVQAVGPHALVRTPRKLRVVDAATGKTVTSVAEPADIVEVINVAS